MASIKKSIHIDVVSAEQNEETEVVNLERSSGALGENSVDKQSLSDDYSIGSGMLTADMITAETLSPSCKELERQRLEAELCAFLSKGGKIQSLSSDQHISKA
jgi:hypothetical protein